MKSSLYTLLTLFGLILFLSSCSTPKMFTTLDILRPAQVTFAPEVNSILLVDNSLPQPSDIGHYVQKIDKEQTNVELKFDSAAIFCTASLREALEGKAFFNNVHLAQNKTNVTDSFYKITPLTKEIVKTLCGIYHVDAVVSLDRLLSADKITEYMIANDNIEYGDDLDVKIFTDWSIHYPTDKPVTYTQFTDSFTWESSSANINKAADDLPKRYDALVDASLLTGSNIADRFIPHWEKEDRYFFTPRNKTMREAMDSVVVRNWKAAIGLWKKAAENSRSQKLKFQSYNNMAIASEILGDLNNAQKYCDEAINSYPYTQFYSNEFDNEFYQLTSYQKELKRRVGEIKLLKKQLGN